jgi:hypothetical protein
MREQKITLGEMRGMRAPARHFGLDPIARQAQEKRPPVTPNGSFLDRQFPGSAYNGCRARTQSTLVWHFYRTFAYVGVCCVSYQPCIPCAPRKSPSGPDFFTRSNTMVIA